MDNVEKPQDKYAILESTGQKLPQENDLEPDEEERKIVSAVQNKRDLSYEKTASLRRMWEYNHLMLQGESLLARTKLDQTFLRVVTESDPRKPRSKDNILREANRVFTGKMVRTIPTMAVNPASEDREDMEAAEIAESFKDFVERKERIRIKYKRAVEHLPANGTSVWEVLWDPLAGDDVWYCKVCGYKADAQPQDMNCPACAMQQQAEMQQMMAAQQMQPGMPQMPPPEQQPVPKLVQARTGDIKVVLHDAEDFYPDPGAAEPDDQEWCIFEKIMPVSKLRRMFPQKADLISAEGDLYQDRYVYAPNGLEGAQIETNILYDHARLLKAYQVPTGDHPKGRIIYIACGRVMQITDNIPYTLIGRLPIFLSRSDRQKKNMLGEEIVSPGFAFERESHRYRRAALCVA